MLRQLHTCDADQLNFVRGPGTILLQRQTDFTNFCPCDMNRDTEMALFCFVREILGLQAGDLALIKGIANFLFLVDSIQEILPAMLCETSDLLCHFGASFFSLRK